MAIRTVGELIKALSEFPPDQQVRVSVPSDIHTGDPFGHFVSDNIHEWGLVSSELWSDGAAHAVVQIPITCYTKASKDDLVEPDSKWFVGSEDGDGETHFGIG